MKKGTIIALIVAVALIFAGGVLLVLGLSYAEDQVPEPVLTQRTIPLTEPFRDAGIVTKDCDVHIDWVQTWEEARIEIQEYPQAKHEIFVEDEGLNVKLVDHREWFNRVAVFYPNMQMRLYLPRDQVAYLGVSTDTGDITLEPNVAVTDISLVTDTGMVYCEAQTKNLDIETSTGDIVCVSLPDWAQIKTDTGYILLGAMDGDGEYHVEADTGKIDIHGLKCNNLICENDTGDVFLWVTEAQESIQITTNTGDVYIGNSTAGMLKVETDTGDVEIEDSDAGVVNIETDTGDIEGHFLTSKWFQVHSDTGSVRVPDTREGGECRIESNTGDIQFE